MSLLQNIVFGVVNGSYIAIAAIGFTLIYGLLNFINFAYGEYITIGGYLGFLIVSQYGIHPAVGIPLTIGATAVAGWLLARVFFTPMNDTGPIPLLLTSIGLGLLLRNGILFAAGGRAFFFAAGNPTVFRFDSLGFYVNTQHLSVVLIGLATFGVTHLLLTRTEIGIAMRAMGANEDLARVSGINTDYVRIFVWVLASGLAGLAGYLLASQGSVSPTTGFNELLIVIAAAILGGAGSPYGAIVGSYILGLVIALTVGLLPTWATELGTSFAFLVLIGVLLVRPGGITGQEVREA